MGDGLKRARDAARATQRFEMWCPHCRELFTSREAWRKHNESIRSASAQERSASEETIVNETSRD
jgi:hypothetical protein